MGIHVKGTICRSTSRGLLSVAVKTTVECRYCVSRVILQSPAKNSSNDDISAVILGADSRWYRRCIFNKIIDVGNAILIAFAT